MLYRVMDRVDLHLAGITRRTVYEIAPRYQPNAIFCLAMTNRILYMFAQVLLVPVRMVGRGSGLLPLLYSILVLSGLYISTCLINLQLNPYLKQLIPKRVRSGLRPKSPSTSWLFTCVRPRRLLRKYPV